MSDKASRILRIYARLRRGPVTIEILKDWAVSNDIFVSERSLYRDLKEIERIVLLAGERVVVTSGEKNRKTWKVLFEGENNPLNDEDLNTFILFRNFAPLSLLTAQKASLAKFENFFYSAHSVSHFENKAGLINSQIASSHFYENADTQNYKKALSDCIWSIQNCRELHIRKLDFDYTSISKSITFPLVFLPIQLLYHRGEIHLVGYTKESEKLLVIGIEQLTKYKLSNEMFSARNYAQKLKAEMALRFGITENTDDEVHDIEIEFSAMTGAFMQHLFCHITQKFTRKKNGNYILKMRCGINRELVGWIFQWMSNVKVIKPEVLRNQVESKLKDVLNLYLLDHDVDSNNSFRRE